MPGIFYFVCWLPFLLVGSVVLLLPGDQLADPANHAVLTSLGFMGVYWTLIGLCVPKNG